MTIDTAAVRAFFDGLAPAWDSGRITREDILQEIMDFANITPGCRVLDVACGTGVLFPCYLERGVAAVTGIDLSPEMVRIARKKHRDRRLTVLAGDVEEAELGEFDRIVVLNALPHFPDPARLLSCLGDRLAPGGRLTVAHDRCRDSINGHHQRKASAVSLGLPPAEETAELFPLSLRVDTVIDGERFYVVSGVL
ncbi:MAG: class I SAM-dependent methyltransferase [Oscillospiraceae bacterium]|nr:class I SAM-dependent methyltransferase [Oscillospiraceae bacterium]